MKKLLLLVAGIFISSSAVAQVDFGVTAGYMNMTAKASYMDVSNSQSESGYFLGAMADISISESFHVQPGVNYANVKDSNMLYVPLMAKYYVGNSAFNIQAGPQAAIILDENTGGLNAVGLDLGFGAGYDINENFFLEARYAFELTNRIKNIESVWDTEEGDAKGKVNSFQVGVGYKF